MNSFTTRTAPPWRRLTFWVLIIVALALINGSMSQLYAQVQDISALFPEPPQVTADFPDDAERFVAFSMLYDALDTATPKPMSKATYEKISNYGDSSNAIASLHMMNGGMQTQAYRDFNTRCNQLLADSDFVRSVFDKYHLTGMPAHPPTPAVSPTANVAPSTDVDNEMKYNVAIQFLKAIPFVLLGLIPMAVFAWLSLWGSGLGRKVLPVPAPVPGGLPLLPQPLQVVTVPGLRYAVYVLSGRVIENRITVQRDTTTITTGQLYQYDGGQTYTTPVQTSTSTVSTRGDAIWVRTPNNRETPWTLVNSGFQTRAGQIISIIVRPLRGGGGDILVAYNHTTETLELCPALKKTHRTGRVELSQWAANIAGGVTAATVLALFLPMRDKNGIYMGFVVAWFFAMFVLIAISFFIITPSVKALIIKRRNETFARNYVPGFRQFFEQGTPVLQKSFESL